MDAHIGRPDPVYLEVLEQLTLAWAEGRKVRVWHRHSEDDAIYSYIFAPYFIEPYAVGQSTHVIGFRQPPAPGAIRTFKIERISQVELLNEWFVIPEDFDPHKILKDAWGIWYTDNEPQDVVLRFHPRVAQRVQETRWHRAEQVWIKADGFLIWRSTVAEPREMLPWIRGWGADVEVLAPPTLRQALHQEADRLALLYGIQQPEGPEYKLYSLWAKAKQSTGEIHSLIYHLIDVAQVTWALWQNSLSKALREQLATIMGVDVEAAGKLLAFWAGLHDLGKCSPVFQRKYPPAIERLERAGLSFPNTIAGDTPHGIVSAWILGKLLGDETHLDQQIAGKIALAVGGHHGNWPALAEVIYLKQGHGGDHAWQQAQAEFFRALQSVVEPSNPAFSPDSENINALLTLLSGLTSVADWIGSMENYFPYEQQHITLSDYAVRAAEQAQKALRELGWIGWQSTGLFASFEDVFPFSRNDVQRAVIQGTTNMEGPALAILEAPTGSGKTEAALFVADTWVQRGRGTGIYIAMPTQATSNQIFRRMQEFLEKRYPDHMINYHLLHGQAHWSKDVERIRLENVLDDEREHKQGKVAAMSWFLPRKRGLLAPFAVGTVDQVLLSILSTKHFFVRLFGLSHKVVIFDEVHAYDTYMSTLFHRLLAWLRAIGASVLILSATLPVQTRRALISAYGGSLPQNDNLHGQTAYPRLTLVSAGKVEEIPVPYDQERTVTLEWIPREASIVAARLRDELRDGGCAVIICNTVRRAQEVFRAIKAAGIVSEEHLLLFHAAFPFVWRDDIEKNTLRFFGKKGEGRPEKSILVATQVVEQSLDLDFDLMVSDLAPVDLVIQRAGRLHRHQRAYRPTLLSTPRLLITSPELLEGKPQFESDEFVYERYVLLTSYLALQDRTQLILPSDTDTLIEAVYGEPEASPAWPSVLREDLDSSRRAMQKRFAKAIQEANNRLVAKPNHEGMVFEGNLFLEEEDPQIHHTLQALTRLSEPNVQVLCLHKAADGRISLDPNSSMGELSLDEAIPQEYIVPLLQRTVTVRHRGVLNTLLTRWLPEPWSAIAALRYHRLAIFEHGQCSLSGTSYVLRLSPDLGLEIKKEDT